MTFEVTDGDLPAMAAFEIRDSLGRVYPLQSKRLAPDFFFHPQIYRGPGETVRLPAGTYTLHAQADEKNLWRSTVTVLPRRVTPVTLAPASPTP